MISFILSGISETSDDVFLDSYFIIFHQKYGQSWKAFSTASNFGFLSDQMATNILVKSAELKVNSFV